MLWCSFREILATKGQLIQLPPNRVWRTYSGGKVLDQISGIIPAKDSHFPEDWIASTTKAINPGRESISEGVSQAIVSEQSMPFDQLLATDYDYFLGADHIAQHGPQAGKLIKFLDSSTRLHFQCHPTSEFSRKYLNSNHGKFEAYHILAIREDQPAPYIDLGFQSPPTPEELKQMVLDQDMTRLESCFEKIPIKVGETYVVPGGIPHAIGAGVLMIEIMEPSDWAARIEFERDGFVIPEQARFLGRDIDFALSIFNHTAIPVETVRKKYQCSAREQQEIGLSAERITLIDEVQTSCFKVHKIHALSSFDLENDHPWVGIITKGSCRIETEAGSLILQQYDKFFCPYGLRKLSVLVEDSVEILQCS
ncbi:MAG: class I mannose-6-phosphate isomerase [Opitutales bacterium]|nr:class I mannose-6-phosphate isomerase [Opitutales bacterium]